MATADTESDTPSDTDTEQPEIDAPTVMFYVRALAANILTATVSHIKQKAKKTHALAVAGITGLGGLLVASAPAIATAMLVGLGIAVVGLAAFVAKVKLTS